MEYIYIDSNIFNFIFDHGINLRDEFPADLYELRIVGEQNLENRAIPQGKQDLKDFIYNAIKSYPIKVDRLFGFYDERHTSEDQRVGGFGSSNESASNAGRYADIKEYEFITSERSNEDEKKRSGLYPNETDISLGARSVAGGIVISMDAKKGPLPRAKAQGGRVVFLNNFDPEKEKLRSYVEREANITSSLA